MIVEIPETPFNDANKTEDSVVKVCEQFSPIGASTSKKAGSNFAIEITSAAK